MSILFIKNKLFSTSLQEAKRRGNPYFKLYTIYLDIKCKYMYIFNCTQFNYKEIFMAELNITKDTFQKEVLESDKPVIVDFWATWCGPCRMLGPTISEIAEEHPEIKVCKVNVDDEPDLAQQFNVMSIPFVASFKGGQLHKSSVGVQPKEALLSLLD